MTLLYFFLLFSVINLQATVCKVSLFKNDEGNCIFLFSDWHREDDQCGTKSKRQQDEVIFFAKSLNAYLIAEDMSDYMGTNMEVKQRIDESARNREYMRQNKLSWSDPLDIENNVKMYADYFLPDIIKH